MAEPWSRAQVGVGAPDTAPERGGRLWAAHAAAAAGIHLLPVLSSPQCSYLLTPQPSRAEEKQRETSKFYNRDLLPKQQSACGFCAVAGLLL